MDPILLDIPNSYSSERLLLRAFEKGDGMKYFTLLQNNVDHLEEEVSEAKKLTTVDKTEIFCRTRMIDWLMKIEIHAKAGNTKSWKLAERCGFTKEAHIRNRARTNKGEIDDLVYYGLLKDEFVAK